VTYMLDTLNLPAEHREPASMMWLIYAVLSEVYLSKVVIALRYGLKRKTFIKGKLHMSQVPCNDSNRQVSCARTCCLITMPWTGHHL
jgi:hypothetical protein